MAAATRARLREGLLGSRPGDLTSSSRREAEWHALNLEIARSRRGDGRFVLAFLDVDDLKGINDRAGHAAGDLVLQHARGDAALEPSVLRPHRALRG